MMGHRAWRRWPRLALAAICLAMLAVIGTELRSSEAGIEPLLAERRPPHAISAVLLSFRMPSLGDFSEVLARPLFSPSRRPGAPAGRLAASSAFKLVGIVIAPQDRRALLGLGEPTKIVRARVGQDIAGWTVEAILPDKVIVRRADVREEVKPKDGIPGASVAGPAAAAPVAFGSAPLPKWLHHSHDQ